MQIIKQPAFCLVNVKSTAISWHSATLLLEIETVILGAFCLLHEQMAPME